MTDLRRQWNAFAEVNQKRMAHDEDDLWRQFKAQHGFDPANNKQQQQTTTKDSHESEFSYKSSGVFPTDEG